MITKKVIFIVFNLHRVLWVDAVLSSVKQIIDAVA